MKKLLAFSLISSSIFLGINTLNAEEYEAFGIDYSGDASIGNRVWGVLDGQKTLLSTKVFDNNGWTPAESYINAKTGEIMVRGAGTKFHAYNWKTDTWRDISDNGNFQKYFVKPMSVGTTADSSIQIGADANDIDVVEDGLNIDGAAVITKNTDGSIQLGADGNDIDVVADGLNIDGTAVITKNADGTIQIGTDENDIDITSEGLAIDGEPLITKKANGELHIGKNSWITKEENGRQKVYAKDANGNPIPIDYTNGTKLLINGRDVEQSINNVGALSAALTGLPTVPTDTTLACGLGTGTHGGDFAFSGGCASKVNDKLSINYAASMTMPGQDYAGDFEDTFSARAGFVWKLGKATKPIQISMNEKENFETKIKTLEEKNKQLLARLERLEKVALGDLKSKDLAVYKLK